MGTLVLLASFWFIMMVLYFAVFADRGVGGKRQRETRQDEAAGTVLEGQRRGNEYEVMDRLLSAEDLHFLLHEEGLPQDFVKRVWQTRRDLYESYVNELARSFRELHVEARKLVGSEGDLAQDYGARLMRIYVDFELRLMRVRMSLFVVRFVLRPLRAPSLVSQLEQMERYAVEMAALRA